MANALFVLSLALPCAIRDDYPEDRFMFGVEIVLKGWAGPLAGDFAWYANIPLLYVSYRLWRKKPVRARGCLAALLALGGCSVLFPALHEWSWFLSSSMSVMVGAYVWGGSMLLAACAALLAPPSP